MTYRLSLLDKSPVAPGSSGADALAVSTEAARLADQLGYHRYWFAEHHGQPGLASAAPELLIAHVAALTQRIRLGSGGVLIQHYSAYKLGELFSILASLAPGRIDVGIGKSPGGLPLATRALQSELAEGSAQAVTRKIEELSEWLKGQRDGTEIHPRATTTAAPFLLGGSPASAEQAARLGWNFVHAGHQDGDRANTLEALARFEAIAGHRPLLAVQAFAAPTRAEAEDRVAGLGFVRLTLEDGHAVNLQSEEGAHEYARQYGAGIRRIEAKTPTVIAGTADEVHAELHALSQDLGVTEFIIDQPVPEAEARLRSIRLIARDARQAAA
ncbi:MsnO8 family LLM class oxidoreductase [Celeribacter indicus]|uniref:MsnO8 family LLM class oxidoreductase n=1 Tax=Celeribacter indicus TaxID=1208324 RepID=UPI0005C34368|nr:MsnO8 family LLM class oxidoreductase [Celeribacter indicus]SDW38087.1 luciferase family oxidoreductase, group 1 [Celeribacter indicus]